MPSKPTPTPAKGPQTTDRGIYIAFRNQAQRSQMEDTLVLDGFNVTTFPTARALWEAFREGPSRFVIT